MRFTEFQIFLISQEFVTFLKKVLEFMTQSQFSVQRSFRNLHYQISREKFEPKSGTPDLLNQRNWTKIFHKDLMFGKYGEKL